jgi:3-isopropylmalate/(R)-2-methylmalate dehydratase small subunit
MGKILVAGKNFGSGSSREHAVWALYDYGFRCVVSSFFADIFKNNCLNIGVLPVTVSPEFADLIFATLATDPGAELEVNLPEQTITLCATGAQESFDINDYKKHNMQHGFDDIDYLISLSSEIATFAGTRRT